MREAMMGEDDDGNSLDRRIFLGASTATLLGLPGISLAQQQRPSGPGSGSRRSIGRTKSNQRVETIPGSAS
jgi:hypothetical protein